MIIDKKILVIGLIFFVLGFAISYKFFPQETIITKEKTVKGDVRTETKTELVYIPKTVYIDSAGQKQTENTDLQMDIGKQELNVKINGKDAVIKKEDSEKYVFDKNKLQLNQSSKSEINITVPTVDKTKHWGVGIGYGYKGIAYNVDFPINKKNGLGGWVYGDDDKKAAGLKFRF